MLCSGKDATIPDMTDNGEVACTVPEIYRHLRDVDG
jgi:hypothetical protein